MKRGRGCRRADAKMWSRKGHKSKLKGECLNQAKRRAVYRKGAQITFYLQLRLGKMCLRRKRYKKLNLRRRINEWTPSKTIKPNNRYIIIIEN
jgi:hypothetical protein